jgi:polyhydroxybutyrate depolymerase
VESLKRELKADSQSVFVTGHSNGGRFVYVLWATRADVISALAPSASPATGLLYRMKPKPCLHIAGENDRLVPLAMQQRTITQVRRINGCEADGHPWGHFGGKVTLYPSRAAFPLVTAIYPGGHILDREAPEVIARFFKGGFQQRDDRVGPPLPARGSGS